MNDVEKREKVIKGLECCAVGCRSGCPYSDIDDCESALCADALSLLKAQEPRLTRCRDCKHKPEYDPPYSENECDLVFPDDVCPMQCGDNWYSKRMPDDFFCAAGEGG